MERGIIYLLCYLCTGLCHLSGKTKFVCAIEEPSYKVVRSETDFEIRLYNESSWMSASVRGSSFNLSTEVGFHRLYQYIHGANLNSSHIAFTAPVLTSITSSSTSSGGNVEYTVRFYMSPKYKANPPQPSPELKLHLDKWNSHCVAVRKFSGFARDDDIDKEVQALVSSIKSHLQPPGGSAAIPDKGSYAIAQYNGSHELSGRLNEAWISISGSSVVGCPPSQ